MAQQRLSERAELVSTAPEDFVHVLDVSDTGDAPTGSSRKVQIQNLIPDAVLTGKARTYTKQQNTAAAALTDGTTVAWNLDDAQNAKLTLGGNRTLANPSNVVDGGSYSLVVKQDGTGNRTLAYGTAYKFPGGTAPTLSTAAGAVDVLACVSDGTAMYCVLQNSFS